MAEQAYLLSVIVPFHNDAAFIVPCLTSLLTQADDDMQVIIIDDGSTDSSAQQVATLLAHYPHQHITFIQQENQGIATTRNVGLRHARGEFITFLDGDDMVSSNYYSVIKPVLLEGSDDLIDFNYARFDETPPVAPQSETAQRKVYDIQGQGLACLHPLFKRAMWHLWNRIYRRTLLEGDRFEDGRRYEDVIFTPFQYFKTRHICHLDNTLYYYRDNRGGITRNIRQSDIRDMLFALEKMRTLAETRRNEPDFRRLAADMMLNCFSEVKSMSKALYGYYYYSPETRKSLKAAALICRGYCKPKKYWQMRYPGLDTFFSAMRRIGKKKPASALRRRE